DAARHQHSAMHGFRDPNLQEQALVLLAAADRALPEAHERALLTPLWEFAQQRTTPAQAMGDRWRTGMGLVDVLSQGYAPELTPEKQASPMPKARAING
ncbi:MAG: hypothetical protein AAF282_22345, partial [Cyanobacteria bacterium P01_A01_bin.15]